MMDKVCGLGMTGGFENEVMCGEGVTVLAKPIINLIRTGQAQGEREAMQAQVRKVIFEILRSGEP